MKEYLPQIGSRQKWYFRNDNLRVGCVVVVIDPGTVRRQWNVGRIEQTYLGPDCLVREVDVRVNGNTLKRPITIVKPVLSGHRIKWTPSIKRTVAEVPKFISLIYFK